MNLAPINQAEIDEIIAKYDAQIAQFPAMEASSRALQQMEIEKAIMRQRQEAIAAGGELGERIKAENEAAMKEAMEALAKIDPAVLERAKQQAMATQQELAALKA